MLESQNVKASYHPMSIRFFFINSTPICRGGCFLTPLQLVMPMQYCPWDTTQAMRSHQRSLGGRPRKRFGIFLCPLNFTFALHSCPSFQVKPSCDLRTKFTVLRTAAEDRCQ